jgi:hypothetical protein
MQKGKNMGIMTTLKKTYPRKPALLPWARLTDHLVGPEEECRRHRYAERLGRLQIDD